MYSELVFNRSGTSTTQTKKQRNEEAQTASARIRHNCVVFLRGVFLHCFGLLLYHSLSVSIEVSARIFERSPSASTCLFSCFGYRYRYRLRCSLETERVRHGLGRTLYIYKDFVDSHPAFLVCFLSVYCFS